MSTTPRFPGISHRAADGTQLVPVGEYEWNGLYAFAYVGYRPPLKGEFYLSGAKVAAWRAPTDLTTACHVVKLGAKYKPVRAYAKV